MCVYFDQHVFMFIIVEDIVRSRQWSRVMSIIADDVYFDYTIMSIIADDVYCDYTIMSIIAGDVCFDDKSGFWLVHSLPRFPNVSSQGYHYPHSGLIYGQTFLCVTYPYKTLNTIGKTI